MSYGSQWDHFENAMKSKKKKSWNINYFQESPCEFNSVDLFMLNETSFGTALLSVKFW